jgi:hypothetical protein
MRREQEPRRLTTSAMMREICKYANGADQSFKRGGTAEVPDCDDHFVVTSPDGFDKLGVS